MDRVVCPERSGTRRGGFTLLETLVVLVVTSIMLGFGLLPLSSYLSRASARRAAEVFARDLTLARTAALSTQEGMVLRFYNDSLKYEWISVTSDVEIAVRRLDDSDFRLSGIDLLISGDTLRYNTRGELDLSGAAGELGSALFVSGTDTFSVYFNGLGAWKLQEGS